MLDLGMSEWNRWLHTDLNRGQYGAADLEDADLSGRDLTGIDFSEVCLRGANLSGALLRNATICSTNFSYATMRGVDLVKTNASLAIFAGADLRNARMDLAWCSAASFVDAILTNAFLTFANLANASFIRADLQGANLASADLFETDLTEANLSGSHLMGTRFIRTNLTHTKLTNSRIYGTTAWDVILDETEQSGLIISPTNENAIIIDSLEVSQFLYLLLNNTRIKHAVEQITTRVALILGRFTPERKHVLDSLRSQLKMRGYIAVIFDFEPPTTRSFIETVRSLAGMAKFIIADVTEPRVIMQELQAIIPDYPSVPVQPIVLSGGDTSISITDFMSYQSFLPLYEYTTEEELIKSLPDQVIGPSEIKAEELRNMRNEKIRTFRTTQTDI